MSKKLYLDDSYRQDFTATVTSVQNGKYVVLDQSAFYPRSGGQAHDEGYIVDPNGTEYQVKYVIEKDGDISHEVDTKGLEEGMRVHAKIDWDRRHKIMRLHTASHVLSNIVNKHTGAMITGNKITDEKLRMDFDFDSFDREAFHEYIEETNQLLTQGLDVETFYMDRDEVMEKDWIKLKDRLPPNIDELRIVKIGDVDIQPGGGTHVQNTKEVGRLSFSKYKNKGKDSKRVYLTLTP